MSRPLRVTFVITGLGIGGAEHALLKLLAALDRHRIAPSLVVLGALDTLLPACRELGVPTTVLGMRAGRWPVGEVRRLLTTLRAQAPDLLQGWMYHGNLAASFAAARLGVPVCWSVRDTPDAAHGHSRFTRMTIALSRAWVGRVACIFNVSARSAAYCSTHLGWPAARTEVLPNGLDLTHFRPDEPARGALRATLGLAADVPLVGMVARWSPVKNHRLFLEALAGLRGMRPTVQAVLVGTGVDAGNAELRGWIDGLALRGAVHLLGPRHDMAQVYPAFDLLVLTSHSEGFPNVLVEAMACGVPVVSTDVGDAAEIVGDCGRIAPAEPAALAHAADALLAAAGQGALGEAARARVAARYEIGALARRLAARYEVLAGARV